MPQRDETGKLTYKMTSAGEAWMQFVNSKEGHNAAAVTPAYLDNSHEDVTNIEKRIDNAVSKKRLGEIKGKGEAEKVRE